MSKTTILEMIVPHIMIMEEEKEKKVNEEEVIAALLDITASYDQVNNKKYGIIPLNESENPDESILAGWFSNTYSISYKLVIGKERKNDLQKVMTEVANMLVNMSKELTLSTNDKSVESFEDGLYRIKYGSGEKRRIYEISYSLKDSNVMEVVKSLEELIVDTEEMLEKEEQHIPQKRVLH